MICYDLNASYLSIFSKLVLLGADPSTAGVSKTAAAILDKVSIQRTVQIFFSLYYLPNGSNIMLSIIIFSKYSNVNLLEITYITLSLLFTKRKHTKFYFHSVNSASFRSFLFHSQNISLPLHYFHSHLTVSTVALLKIHIMQCCQFQTNYFLI